VEEDFLRLSSAEMMNASGIFEELQARFQHVILHGLLVKVLRRLTALDLQAACLPAPSTRGDQMTESSLNNLTTRPFLWQLYEETQVILVFSCYFVTFMQLILFSFFG
jgi:hypothetical protein